MNGAIQRCRTVYYEVPVDVFVSFDISAATDVELTSNRRSLLDHQRASDCQRSEH